MAVNETIITGRKWRRLIDKASGLWQRISYWTHSSDVEFDDGKDAETKVGAIDGITDSLVSTSSRIAASAKAVNTLSNDLGGVSFGITEDGQPGWKDGADTVHPFKSKSFQKIGQYTVNKTVNIADEFPNDYGSLTLDNFIAVASNAATAKTEYGGAGISQTKYNPPSLSYNPSTGNLSVVVAKLTTTGSANNSWNPGSANISTAVYVHL